MNHKSRKNLEAEKYVDEYIAEHGIAPTYREISEKLGITLCAAHGRCKKFRFKFARNKKQEEPNPHNVFNLTYKVPPEKLSEFVELLGRINELLKQ